MLETIEKYASEEIASPHKVVATNRFMGDMSDPGGSVDDNIFTIVNFEDTDFLGARAQGTCRLRFIPTETYENHFERVSNLSDVVMVCGVARSGEVIVTGLRPEINSQLVSMLADNLIVLPLYMSKTWNVNCYDMPVNRRQTYGTSYSGKLMMSNLECIDLFICGSRYTPKRNSPGYRYMYKSIMHYDSMIAETLKKIVRAHRDVDLQSISTEEEVA